MADGTRELTISIEDDGHVHVRRDEEEYVEGAEAVWTVLDDAATYFGAMAAGIIVQNAALMIGRKAWWNDQMYKRDVLGRKDIKTIPSIFTRIVTWVGAASIGTVAQNLILRQHYMKSPATLTILTPNPKELPAKEEIDG